MNEEIIIYKRKKIEIIQDLIQSEFHQVVNGKIIEEKNKSKDVKTNNYDYLIKMSLYSFTEDEIDRLNKEYDKSKFEYDTLKNKTIETIWLEELHSLSKQYLKYKLKK